MFTMSPLFFAKAAAATFLDQFSVKPMAVYSLRRMISSATSAIRVRRSSDNTEQDIGFTGNALNTSALATFVGSGSGFITRFYDQTGGGLNMVQTTTTKQPRIVNAGVYDGAAIFDGTDDAMSIPAVALNKAQAALYGKIRQNTTGTKIVLEAGTNFNSATFSLAFYVESSNYAVGMNNASANSQKINYFPLAMGSALTQFSLLYDRSLTGNAETQAWSGGTSRVATNVPPYTNEQSGTFATNDLYIGSRAGTSLYSDMNLETLVIYNADSALLRSSIEAIVA